MFFIVFSEEGCDLYTDIKQFNKQIEYTAFCRNVEINLLLKGNSDFGRIGMQNSFMN